MREPRQRPLLHLRNHDLHRTRTTLRTHILILTYKPYFQRRTLGIAIEDAVVALHAQAFGSGRSVVDIARDVVHRRVRFIRDRPQSDE